MTNYIALLDRFKTQVADLPDRVLVFRAQRGDREAFAKLYAKYLDAIYRYVFFRTGQDQARAEDLCSDVFVKAWEKLAQFEATKASFKTWLYQVARNTVIDSYRKRRLETVALADQPDIADSTDIQADMIDQMDLKQIHLALNHLTSEQQEVITYKFIEGLSNDQICQIMGKNHQTIRAMQYRALKKLKQLVQA